ncbi:hypothetical protein SAMN05661103_1074 [Agrobacterium sp. 719_389]|nr:hypothetical protein SAMN05661103_1074 [Agrobacterium sp. 719_389]
MREAGAFWAPVGSRIGQAGVGHFRRIVRLNPYLKLWTVTREEAGPDANRGSS